MDDHFGESSDIPAAAARMYACATCGKRYQRNTHLRRHEATHAATGKFQCIYCDKEFGRGDVCRKHMLNCVKRDTETIVPELRRGRKPKACEACFNSKVSCDKGNPCGRCILRHLPCRPREIGEEGSKSTLSAFPETLPSQSFNTQDTQQQQQQQQSSLYHTGAVSSGILGSTSTDTAGMPWLKALINPRAASMLEHMTNDSTSQVTERIPDMSFLSGEPSSREPHLSSDVPDLLELYPWNYATMLDDAVFNFDGLGDINMLSMSDDMPAIPAFNSPSSSEGMADTSLYLVNSLHDLHNELCASDPTYSEKFDVNAVSMALCPANLKQFAANFFRLSHIHFPIVHIPSFGRYTSSKSLLLVLVIQGAFRSPPLDHVLVTRGLLRLAEEYVFRELQDFISLGTTQLPMTPTLEALQAALVLVYLLVINNSVSSRRQSRVRRVPELAYAVRHFDLANVRHAPNEDWQLYIYRETCIRIATWTAVADWHQCGMFRCMPILATTELNCDHPCSTAIWDAGDENEFALAMAEDMKARYYHHSVSSASSSTAASSSSSSAASSAQSSIHEFVSVLMDDKWNRSEQCPRQSFDVYDLHNTIVALSTIALTADIMAMMPSSAAAILRALSRWQELWADMARELGSAAIMKTGIAGHSNESCLLTRKLIEASINKSRHPYFQKVGHQSLTEIYSFLIDG